MDLRELPGEPFVRHPWEVARARFFVKKVLERARGTGPLRVLDVGAGDGYLAARLLRELPRGSSVECVDPNYTDAQLATLSAHAPGVAFEREPSSSEFDWILLLDVLEHVPDDAALLSDIVSHRLVDGGLALVSVPAWQSLYTAHDVALGHHRRYRPDELAGVLARGGLVRVEQGSLFASLVIPRLLAKAAERLRGVKSAPSDAPPPEHAPTDAASWRGGRALTGVVGWLLDEDIVITGRLARAGVSLPGLSTWGIGRKT